jgi:hypothetical protein
LKKATHLPPSITFTITTIIMAADSTAGILSAPLTPPAAAGTIVARRATAVVIFTGTVHPVANMMTTITLGLPVIVAPRTAHMPPVAAAVTAARMVMTVATPTGTAPYVVPTTANPTMMILLQSTMTFIITGSVDTLNAMQPTDHTRNRTDAATTIAATAMIIAVTIMETACCATMMMAQSKPQLEPQLVSS